MAKTKKTKQTPVADALKTSAEELLKLMGSKAQVEVSEDPDNEALLVNIQTDEERGLLIGNHGEVLLAIQSALGMILKQQVGEWQRIIVNIGDWREKQEDYLKNLALQTSERVKESGKEEYLYNLTPAQRRIIHLTLSEVKGIVTESEGEEDERCLIVKPSK